MNSVRKVDFNVKYICLTAYRTLLLLKYLIISPLNKQQILDVFDKHDIIAQPVTVENMRSMINSLKQSGCVISRPNLANNYKYELLKNPFSLNFTKDEIFILNKYRRKFLGKKDWREILSTNSLFDKICLAIEDENTKENLKNRGLLLNVDINLVRELEECCQNNKTVVFDYVSGRTVSKFEMITSFLKYERERLYVWGYSPKYKDFSYLRVDKIKSFKVEEKPSVKIYNSYVIRYENYNPSYFLEENETLVEKRENSLVIDYRVENKFRAIQKFLELGLECKIISPEVFKKEFVETVKSVYEVYDEDK